MHIGIWSRNLHYGVRPDEIARACEARGIKSLWVGEHTHIPVKALPRLADFQQDYFHIADPFISLMAAATATTTLKLGLGACLVVEHDPIVLAKTVATLDLLSNGRLLFGVGAGWIPEEMENHGTAWPQRFQVQAERVAALKAIWTQEEASFHGEFVNFERILSYPKPVQKPYPPILLGSSTPASRRRAAYDYDGWMPIDVVIDDLPAALDDLRQQALAAERDPAAIPVTLFTWDALTLERVERYRDLGIDRMVVVCPVDDYLPFLDQTAQLIQAVQ